MPIDIRQTDDGDILLVNGDIVWADSTLQHQRDILIARPGDFRAHPALGVAAERFAKDDTTEEFFRTIRKQFRQDGMEVKSITLRGTQLKIDANY